MKGSLLLLVMVSNACCWSAIAKAAPLKEDSRESYTKNAHGQTERELNSDDKFSKRSPIQFGTALGHKSAGKPSKYDKERDEVFNSLFGNNKRSQDKRGITFGTAMGHNTKAGKKKSNYMDEWRKTYNQLFPDSSYQKRTPFKFGTALGHSNNNGEGGDYMAELNSKFNELFGRSVNDDTNERWESEQDS